MQCEFYLKICWPNTQDGLKRWDMKFSVFADVSKFRSISFLFFFSGRVNKKKNIYMLILECDGKT